MNKKTFDSFHPVTGAAKQFLSIIEEPDYEDVLLMAVIAQGPPVGGDDDYYFPMQAYFHEILVPHKVAVYERGMGLWKAGAVSDHRLGDQYLEPWKARLIFHDISKFSDREDGYVQYLQKKKQLMGVIGAGTIDVPGASIKAIAITRKVRTDWIGLEAS